MVRSKSPSKPTGRSSKRRALTYEHLRRSALRYLERFSCSKQQLEQYLRKSVRKAQEQEHQADAHSQDEEKVPGTKPQHEAYEHNDTPQHERAIHETQPAHEQAADDTQRLSKHELHNTWIQGILDDFAECGWLDDQRYAEHRAHSLRAQGKSTRHIRQALRHKGIASDVIEQILEAQCEEQPLTELTAATHYARRRRLGPFRETQRGERRQKDLAALGRAGFSYDIAQQVVDAESPEHLPHVDRTLF